MGLFDDVTSALNRGKDAAERTGKSAHIKLQMNDLMRERRELVAQLGASLYDVVKDNPEFRVGRETIFDQIAFVDERHADLQAQLDQIDSEAEAARAAAASAQAIACPNCGTSITGNQAFCTGCGKPVAEIKATLGPVCVSCGAQLQEGDLFCVECGARQPEPGAGQEE